MQVASLARERNDFVGRKTELGELHRHWSEGRGLVTLLGPGGSGKTRLAVHFAHDLVAAAPVWVCDLSAATTRLGCIEALARTLGLALPARADVDVLGNVLGYALSDRGRALLVLDNLEQVAGEVRPLVEVLLDLAPELMVLGTSRERLRIVGEHCVDLGPLQLEDAMSLFFSRARAVRSDFQPAREEASELVTKLDCLPLAIELCAARVRSATPAQLLARLERRFETLVDRGSRPPRQATLEATIDWSWQLLEPDARLALGECSVFRGGFDLNAAEHVLSSGDALELLTRLIDQSLVRVSDAGRYSLLESIREFSLLRMGGDERRQAEERQADYYLSQARAGGVKEADEANLLAVHERAIARGDGEQAAWAALGLEPLLSTRGPLQLLVSLLDAAIPLVTSPTLERRAKVARGLAKVTIGALTEAVKDLEPAVDDPDPRVALHVGARLSVAWTWLDRLDDARRLLERAPALLEQTDDDLLAGGIESAWGMLSAYEGRQADALRHYGAALACFRRCGARREEGTALENLGNRNLERGALPEAEEFLTQALAIFEELGDVRLQAHTLGDIAVLHTELSRFAEAERVLERALGLTRRVGDRHWEGILNGFYGDLELDRGDPESALARYRFAVERLDEIGSHRFAALFRAAQAATEAELGRSVYARELWERARVELDEHGTEGDRHCLSLWRAFMLRKDDPDGARRGLEEVLSFYAREGTEPAPNEVRLPARLLSRTEPPQRTLRVASDAAWFEVTKSRVSLARRTSLRLILLDLIRAREVGEVRSVEELFAAGWPGQSARPESAAHRVHVAIASLRKLGLENAIVTRGEGYTLDASISRS